MLYIDNRKKIYARVSGILVTDKNLELTENLDDNGKRFGDVEDIIEHMLFEAKTKFRNYRVENVNLLEDEYDRIDNCNQAILNFDRKYRSKHNNVNDAKYYETLLRYAERFYDI